MILINRISHRYESYSTIAKEIGVYMNFKVTFWVLFLLNFSICQGSESKFIEDINYPKSWKSAKSKSKKTGKLILVDFYFIGCAPCKKLDEQVFQVDSIRRSLEEKYIIYKYNIHSESKSVVRKFNVRMFPGIIITNHREEKLFHISGFDSVNEFLDKLESTVAGKPLTYYEKNYKNKKKELSFLKEYVDILLEVNVKGEDVFKQYYLLESDCNCRKLRAFNSSELMREESVLKLFLDAYKAHYAKLECKEIEHDEVIFDAQISLSYIEEGIFDINRALNRTVDILDLSESVEDSLVHTKHLKLYANRMNRMEYPYRYTKLLLDSYTYRRENYIYIDSVYTEVLGLSIDLERSDDLQKLENILNSRSVFLKNVNFIELRAVVEYRLGYEHKAIASIVEANESSIKQGKRFKPIFPILKKKGLLTPAK